MRTVSILRGVKVYLGVTLFFFIYSSQAALITVNTNTQYQTIRGWTGVLGASLPPFQTQQIVNRAVNELGLTTARFDCPFNGISATAGDSWVFRIEGTNPSRTNWATFDTLPGVQYNTNNTGAFSIDQQMTQWILPMKQLVETNGDPFTLVNNPSFYYGGSTCTIPSWMQYNYGEYAEYLVSFDEYLAHHYGVVPAYNTIINEAGNNNAMTPFLEAKVIKTMGPMLQAAQLSTKIQLAEGVGANVAATYATDTNMDSDVWKYVGTISWHDYQGTSANKVSADASAVAHGVMTVEEELDAQSNEQIFNYLYDDLVNGGVSFWGHYGIGGYGSGTGIHYFNANYDGASITVWPGYYVERQVMHYVRPGAVRVAATTTDTNIQAIAFLNGGNTTVILANFYSTSNIVTTVTNLPSGIYGVSYATAANGIAELGLQTVDSSGALTVNVLYNTVITIYPHAGTNLPPEIYVNANTTEASPAYLKNPASSVTLTVNAVDPELDPLTYNWQLVSGPGGANVSLANSNSPSATASGMTTIGLYIFVASVSDNHGNTTTRQVGVNVFSGDQPPIVQAVQARAVPGPPYNPPLITLPQNAVELLAQLVYDLQGAPINYLWSVTNQPAGAAALLLSPTNSFCILTNMTATGDYGVQLEVGDGFNVVTQSLTVSVDPPNPDAPTIANVSGAYLSSGQGHLQATTSDADGDWISSWWDVISKPTNSTVTFTDPASATTDFQVDTVGTYTFQLTTVDRTLWTQSADIVVAVTTVPVTLSIQPEGNDMLLAWPAAGFRTNYLQAAWNVSGIYSNIETNILISGNGVTNNYLDVGASTDWPARFYRVRLTP